MFKRNNDFKGGREGKKFGGGNDRGFSKPQLHSATCEKCKRPCEVPFRPTGSKPTYCRDCYRQQGFSHGGDKFSADRAKDNGQVEKRLAEVSAKLDRVLIELETLKRNV